MQTGGPRAALHSARLLVACCAALVAVLALATPAAAHPLGNFTVNHYSGLTVSPDGVRVQILPNTRVSDRNAVPYG